MRLKLGVLAVISVLVLPATGVAKDLGVQGNLWEIEEVDMRILVTEAALAVDTDKVAKERLDAANKSFETMPQFNLPSASETKTTWLDPTVALDQDIQIPVKQPNGEYAWRVVYPKGYRFNVLERLPAEMPRVLFFNGASQDQTAFMVAAMKQSYPGQLMPVATGGNPKTLSEQLKGPVFYATPAMLKRFGIQATPSLFAVGKDDRKKYSAVTTFATPYRVETVRAAWWGLQPTPATGRTK